MNTWLLITSFFIGCAICWPFFKSMYKAITHNAPEFDQGYSKQFKKDATQDFLRAQGTRDSTVNSFVYANFAVLALPLIPSCFVAVPIYFLLRWLFQLIT